MTEKLFISKTLKWIIHPSIHPIYTCRSLPGIYPFQALSGGLRDGRCDIRKQNSRITILRRKHHPRLSASPHGGVFLTKSHITHVVSNSILLIENPFIRCQLHCLFFYSNNSKRREKNDKKPGNQIRSRNSYTWSCKGIILSWFTCMHNLTKPTSVTEQKFRPDLKA